MEPSDRARGRGKKGLHAVADNWSLVVASNCDHVLEQSLKCSPDLGTFRETIIERGHSCAGTAYNRGLNKTTGEIVIFVHHDVFLPRGWAASVFRALERIEEFDPNWGVLGVWGITASKQGKGHIYSTGLRQTLGVNFESPLEVQTLDEVLLIIRRSSGLRFDEDLPGFHLYGTDICLQARRQGMKNYVISAFCLHNSNGIRWLPLAFWKSYFYVRRKWPTHLPISTPCIRITSSLWPVAHYFSWKLRDIIVRGFNPGRRSENPARLYERINRFNLSVGTEELIGKPFATDRIRH